MANDETGSEKAPVVTTNGTTKDFPRSTNSLEFNLVGRRKGGKEIFALTEYGHAMPALATAELRFASAKAANATTFLSDILRFFAKTAGQVKALWRATPLLPGVVAARRWMGIVILRRALPNALTVRETVALGDRRFVSVLEFECQRFLIGSSPSGVTLLSMLEPKTSKCEAAGETE